MSNVKLKGYLEKTYKLLLQFPNGIRITDLAKKREVQRSTIYDHLNTLELMVLAHYERGTAYPVTPKDKKESPKDFGFFGWLERRAERKRLEKERRILDLNIEFYALREEILMDEARYNSEAPEEHARRRQKYRRVLEGS